MTASQDRVIADVSWRRLALPVAAMALVVLASNILVQYPVTVWGLQDFLTFGAFSYPIAFLVSDLTNRRLGARATRRVVYVGFVLALALSWHFATPRIAVASGSAFLAAQLLDVAIFSRLRDKVWWLPPLASSSISSAVDTAIFFSMAFYCGALPVVGGTISDLFAASGLADSCIALPWVSLAAADYGVKLLLAVVTVAPYGAVLRFWGMLTPAPAR